MMQDNAESVRGRYTRKQSAPLTDRWIELVIEYGPQQVGQVVYDCALEIKKLRRDLQRIDGTAVRDES